MKNIFEIEGVRISPAKKITKQRLIKFDKEQKRLAALMGEDLPTGDESGELTPEAEAKILEITKDHLETSLETMGLAAACFLDFVDLETKEVMNSKEIDDFLNEQVDFTELDELANIGAERFLEFKKEQNAKKKLSTKPKEPLTETNPSQ